MAIRFSLYPEDHPERALRLRRQMMAVYSYLLLWLGIFIGVQISVLDPRTPHLWIFAALFAINLVFFVMIRSGFSERFRDPSMTMAQMLAGIIAITVLIHYSRELRGSLLSLYLIVMTFGVFSLDRRQQIIMALCAQGAYTALLAYEWIHLPLEQILVLSFSHWGILALILCWFVYMGGYIHNLQQQLREQRADLRRAHHRLTRIAIRDELTGLYNRRHFLERLDEELSRSEREHAPLQLALVDLDHFKRINDTYGHRAGDQVLQRFAAVAEQSLRRSDVLARYGGEEFIMLFPQSDHSDCEAALNRLREHFAEEQYAFDPDLRVTFSCGLAGHRPGETPPAFIERADLALYRAKSGGRNRILAATETDDDAL